MRLNTDKLESELPRCPADVGQCTYLDELGRLRSEMQTLNAQLRIDALTGLYNFRHFSQALDVEMERTRRSGKPTSLMVIDLDNFKHVNDKYGHDLGNKVLSELALLLDGTTRKLDVACRYGGEEFTVILPDTSLLAAVQLAERLRELIEQKRIDTGEGQIAVTASFGVDCYETDTGETWQQFMDRADSFLLQAKRSGKNKVCAPVPL